MNTIYENKFLKLWEDQHPNLLDYQYITSEWNDPQIVVENQKGMQLRPLPQHNPTPLAQHHFAYEQDGYNIRDGMDESHHIAATLAFLDEDEGSDSRCVATLMGSSGSSSSNASDMYLWSQQPQQQAPPPPPAPIVVVPQLQYNNNNDQHNMIKPLNGISKSPSSISSDIFRNFDAFNADSYKHTRLNTYNGKTPASASSSAAAAGAAYYNGYMKPSWDGVGYPPTQDDATFQPPTMRQELNMTPTYPENESGMLSPQLPSQADLLGIYSLLQESSDNPPTLLDLINQTSNSRVEKGNNEVGVSVPVMNPSIPPPPIIPNQHHHHQQRPRGTLADNKPFPASLAKQVRPPPSMAPPPQRIAPMPHHHHHHQQHHHQAMIDDTVHHFQHTMNISAAAAAIAGKGHESQHCPHPPPQSMMNPPPPASAPRVYPYFPMMPPPFPNQHPFAINQQNPFLNPTLYNLARAQKKINTTSHRLHAHLEVCYEQFRQLEKERKQTEARLASCLPGRPWSSANTLPVPKLPPNPSRVDRLIIDNIREHCRLLTLIGKMEHLGAYKIPASVHQAIAQWKTAIQTVDEARKAELDTYKYNHNVLVFRGASAAVDDRVLEERINQLITSIRQLYKDIRGARTACWATLTCTILNVKERENTTTTTTIKVEKINDNTEGKPSTSNNASTDQSQEN